MTKKPIDTKKYSENDTLSEEELLECLRGWSMDGTTDNWREEDEQAYNQIVALIKNSDMMADMIVKFDDGTKIGHKLKPEVTEEWIDKKAKLFMCGWCGRIREKDLKHYKGIIRSLVEEMKNG